MDLKLLRCFIVLASELHFGRAAQRMDILPSSLSRNIGLLEQALGVRLLHRTTREVSLTHSGELLFEKGQYLLSLGEDIASEVRLSAETKERMYRIGAIDSASTGLLPLLVGEVKKTQPGLELTLVEDKSVKLLPKLQSGALDVALIRPPNHSMEDIEWEFLLHEPTVVALPAEHPLSRSATLTVDALAQTPLIVPSARARPHSHNLTMSLFRQAGLQPHIVQHAEEKQTIIGLVGAGIGVALVPYWTSKAATPGVIFRPLVNNDGVSVAALPLALAWLKGSHDPLKNSLLNLIKTLLVRASA